MKRRILLYWALPLFFLASCDSWLDVVPENDIATIDTDFETYAGADDWLKSCYLFLQDPTNPYNNVAFWATDEMVADNYFRNSTNHPDGIDILKGMQSVLAPLDDKWYDKKFSGNTSYRFDYYTAIVMCNHFITRIDNVYNLSDNDKELWKAEVIAVKAYYYFELVRRYGPVIIVPEDLDPNADVESLKYPRSHVDTCFNYIVRLCDEAAKVLPPGSMKASDRRAYFNKEAALALKMRTLLYAASPLFNGNTDYANFVNKNGEPLFSVTVEKAKWERAANAAKELIALVDEVGGVSLVEGSVANTSLQSKMLDIENSVHTYNFMNDEVLWMVKYPIMGSSLLGYALPAYDDASSHSLQGTCFAPTLKMVEMFYTENGLPIDQDLRWVGAGNPYALDKESDPKYTDVVSFDEPVLNLHRRREPRFYANIVADRCYWRLGSADENLHLVEAYQGEDFGLQAKRLNALEPQNITGYWMKKWCDSRGNLAVHEGELQSFGTTPYPVFRLAEVYLAAAEALNECDAPFAEVYKYLNVIRTRAGIPDVEVAWRNARNPGLVQDRSGLREIIRREWNIEFAFEGYRFWNVRRWKIANVELNEQAFGWNVLGNNANTFYNNGRPMVVYSGNKFVAPRDYFWPIRSEEVQRAGCVQNIGW